MVKEIRLLRQQMDLLTEKSKKPLPEHECEYAFAMAEVGKELFKRESISIMFSVALCYFVMCVTKLKTET